MGNCRFRARGNFGGWLFGPEKGRECQDGQEATTKLLSGQNMIIQKGKTTALKVEVLPHPGCPLTTVTTRRLYFENQCSRCSIVMKCTGLVLGDSFIHLFCEGIVKCSHVQWGGRAYDIPRNYLLYNRPINTLDNLGLSNLVPLFNPYPAISSNWMYF